MALLDLLGRRWALRAMWELRDGEAATFRALQARCGGVSSSVLNQRLRELAAAGLVIADAGAGYRLTADGEELLETIEPIEAWAQGWSRRVGSGPVT